MKWQNKRVFITGAGGFIGSHLTEALVLRGASVKALVRYNSRNDWGLLERIDKDVLAQVDVVAGDLRDSDAIRKMTKDTDVVFHLGSLIAIPYSYEHPRETIETNVIGTLNVLTAALENNVEKMVHTSTSEVYGTARYVPINEEHPLQGQSPYSASKIGADKIVESFYRTYALPVATIRPFNTYGPRQSARAVIPTIITQALVKDRIKLGSLSTTRDYTYVKDTAEGFLRVAESKEAIGEVINVGSNFEISIGELANKIIGMIGRDVKIDCDEARIRPKNSEVERLWCDNSKAMRILKWKPTVPLERGLGETIEWISEHKNLYKPDMYTR